MEDLLIGILDGAVKRGASDIFIIAGFPVAYKLGGEVTPARGEKLNPDATDALIRSLYALAARDISKLLDSGDDDFALSVKELSRFRVSTYRQRGSLAAVIRVIPFGIPDWQKLNIPESVMTLAGKLSGLVLVTGAAGGGKSTTLACVIDRINSERRGHIITLEEPIEYLHRDKGCIVSQREVSLDTESFVTALRASLRQAPDVLLVGEMRDYETIRTAMTAAETGHLVISTLHTAGAASTIDRVIDVFPPNQQQQIRVQLSMVLQSVVSQQLVPAIGGGVLPAFEIMHANSAIRTMIRESKTHQLDAAIASSSSEGMVGMDAYLAGLFRDGKITRETAVRCAFNPQSLERKLI